MEIGNEPSRELGSGEMARRLSLSRESVHQLLLPLVRAGFLVALRGRSGGYRAADGLLSASIAAITEPFEGAPRRGAGGPGGSRVLDELEADAESAHRAVLTRTSLAEVLARVKAEREVPSWEI